MSTTLPLEIPLVTDDDSTLDAALKYAEAGFYVLPIRKLPGKQGKNAGSVLGKGWQLKSSRDPKTITAWFAGSDDQLALHVGRSGCVVIDLDDPGKLPDAIRDAIVAVSPPFQRTRDEHTGLRGHFFFRDGGVPFSNATGDTGHDWGDVRGQNGIVLCAPTVHPEGGHYSWPQTGEVPLIPDELAQLLRRVKGPAQDAATPTAVARFHDDHQGNGSPTLLDVHIRSLEEAESGGRHSAAARIAVFAAKDARLGYYPADCAHDALGKTFESLFTDDEARDRNIRDEWAGCWAWGVGQAVAENIDQLRRGAEKRLKPPELDPLTRHGSERQAIDVTEGAGAAYEWLRAEIGTGPLAGVFLRDGMLVFTAREGEEGYRPPAKGDTNGPAQVVPLKADALLARISDHYDIVQGDKRPMFPKQAVTSVVASPESCPNVRPLRGVIHVPMPRADGRVITEPGYDEESGYLLLPEVDVPPVSQTPTADEVEAATTLVRELVTDFPWVGDHDEANYLGLLLTPLLRDVAPPPYKIGIFTAHQPGSGKSLLAAVLRELHGGQFRSGITLEDTELDKQLMSILTRTTGAVITFDNIKGLFSSPRLDGLLTSDTYDGRILGYTENRTVANDRLWTLTGNNATIGGDMARRALWVTIDPAMPNPETRTGFTITDLRHHVRTHRGQLLHALLTIVRHWQVSGCPTPTIKTSDSYGNWVSVVRGILDELPVDLGTFDHPDSRRQQLGEEDVELITFLEAIVSIKGTETSWTVKELTAGITGDEHDHLREAFPEAVAKVLTRDSTSYTRVVGKYLASIEGRFAGPYVIRSLGTRSHAKVWTVNAVK